MLSSDGVELLMIPNPVEGVLNMFVWPKGEALCPKPELVCCPNTEPDCPNEGVVDWKRGAD